MELPEFVAVHYMVMMYMCHRKLIGQPCQGFDELYKVSAAKPRVDHKRLVRSFHNRNEVVVVILHIPESRHDRLHFIFVKTGLAKQLLKCLPVVVGRNP